MDVIDAHHHLWEYDAKKHAWIDDSMKKLRRNFLPSDLKEEFDKAGVDGCLAVQADQSEEETDFLLRQAQKYDFIRGVVGWVDLCANDVEQRLSHYAAIDKIKGMRHVVQDEPDDNFLLRDDFQNGISKLQRYDLCYDILIFEKHLQVAVKFIENFPDQKFVLDHIAKPQIKDQKIDKWEKGIHSLAEHPKMYCKLSGIITEANWDSWTKEDITPYLDVVMEAFGPERLMFGSDWPVCTLAGSYSEVYNLITNYIAPCSDNEKNAIMGGNAIRFYGL